MCCFISSKKGSEKSSGKVTDVAGRGADSVKGGSVVLSKNALDDGRTCLFISSSMYLFCFVLSSFTFTSKFEWSCFKH